MKQRRYSEFLERAHPRPSRAALVWTAANRPRSGTRDPRAPQGVRRPWLDVQRRRWGTLWIDVCGGRRVP